MINCQQATRIFSDALDRPLTLRERVSVGLHRVICPPCRKFAAHLHVLRDLAHSYARGANPGPSE